MTTINEEMLHESVKQWTLESFADPNKIDSDTKSLLIICNSWPYCNWNAFENYLKIKRVQSSEVYDSK